jgi:hypothetical protein
MEAFCRPSASAEKVTSTYISPDGARVAGRGVEGMTEKQELVVLRRTSRTTRAAEPPFWTVKVALFEAPRSVTPVYHWSGVMIMGDSPYAGVINAHVRMKRNAPRTRRSFLLVLIAVPSTNGFNR